MRSSRQTLRSVAFLSLAPFAFACFFSPPSLAVDPEATANQKKTLTEAIAGTVRDEWVGGVDGPATTVVPGKYWSQKHQSRVSVLLIPGLLAKEESLTKVQEELERTKHPTALFKYSSHQGIESSSIELGKVLSRIAAEDPDRRLAIVTHSMGGLIARHYLELSDIKIANVESLIMIAPPNHGSEVATLTAEELGKCLPIDNRALNQSGAAVELIDKAVNGFFGQAKADLCPNSTILQRMNRAPRAAGIKYSIIAGTGGPIRAEWVEWSSLLGDLLTSGDPALENALKPVRRLAQKQEWVYGRGDGVVAVTSARLDGVTDFITLPFAHNDFGLEAEIGPADNADTVEKVMDELLIRIDR